MKLSCSYLTLHNQYVIIYVSPLSIDSVTPARYSPMSIEVIAQSFRLRRRLTGDTFTTTSFGLDLNVMIACEIERRAEKLQRQVLQQEYRLYCLLISEVTALPLDQQDAFVRRLDKLEKELAVRKPKAPSLRAALRKRRLATHEDNQQRGGRVHPTVLGRLRRMTAA